MIKNLVLAGAQLKGVCYIGVIRALEELNMIDNIQNVLGISSGSLIGLAICLGFSSQSLENMVLKLDIENLKEFQTDSIFKLFYTYGMDSGNKIEKLIRVILKKKTGSEEITFRQLKELFPNKNLIVGGSNLSNAEMEYFIDNEFIIHERVDDNHELILVVSGSATCFEHDHADKRVKVCHFDERSIFGIQAFY